MAGCLQACCLDRVSELLCSLAYCLQELDEYETGDIVDIKEDQETVKYREQVPKSSLLAAGSACRLQGPDENACPCCAMQRLPEDLPSCSKARSTPLQCTPSLRG